MKKVGIKVLQGEDWQIERELLLKEEKIYVLKNKKLRVEIIQLYYNMPVAKYKRKWKMMELVTRNYWWPEVIRDIEQYIEGCDICQRIKNRTKIPVEKLKLSEIPEKLWTHLIVDFITKLLLVARKDVILVACNRLFKITYFVAITEGILAEKLARLFRNNV